MITFDISYAYDNAGNRVSMTDNVSGHTTTYSYDSRNQLSEYTDSSGQTTFQVDDDGNRTRMQTPSTITDYDWDWQNRLTQVDTISDTVDFTYNGASQRVKKQTSLETREYLYDFNNLLRESDSSDNDARWYTYSDNQFGDLISEYEDSEGSSFHQYDAQWSSEALLDENASVTDRYEHRAFGLRTHELGNSESRNSFVGQLGYYRDNDLDLYMLGMGNGDGLGGRFFDPVLGRFLSQDPKRFGAGDSNLYRYVKNNPINAVDPSGQEPFWKKSTRYQKKAKFLVGWRRKSKEGGDDMGNLVQITDDSYGTPDYSVEYRGRIGARKKTCMRFFSTWVGAIHHFTEPHNNRENQVVRSFGVGNGVKRGLVSVGRIHDEMLKPGYSSAFEIRKSNGSAEDGRKIIDNIKEWQLEESGLSRYQFSYANLWTKIKDNFFNTSSLGNFFKAALNAACKQLNIYTGKDVCTGFQRLGPIIGAVWSDAVEIGKTLGQAFKKSFEDFFNFDTLKANLAKVGKTLLQEFFGIDVNDLPPVNGVSDIPKFILHMAGLSIDKLIESAKSFIPTERIEQVTDLIRRVGNGDLVAEFNQMMSETPLKVSALVQEFRDDFWGTLKDKATGPLVTKLLEKIAKLLTPIPGAGLIFAIADLGMGIYDKAQDLKDRIQLLYDKVQKGVQHILDKNVDKVAGVITDVILNLLPPLAIVIAAWAGLGKIADKIKNVVCKLTSKITAFKEKMMCYIKRYYCKIVGRIPGMECTECEKEKENEKNQDCSSGQCKPKPDDCKDIEGPKCDNETGSCFAKGTLVYLGDGSLIPIELVRIGQRVMTYLDSENTVVLGQEFEREVPDSIEPHAFRVVRLVACSASDEYDVSVQTVVSTFEFLRSVEWIEEIGAECGAVLHLDLPEMGVVGPVEVLSIDSCPALDSGPGQLVTSTFRHGSGEIFELSCNDIETIGVTGSHLFWSDDRQDWIQARDLKSGEKLNALNGTSRISKLAKSKRIEPVFNIEVANEHVYRVGQSAILVHNISGPSLIQKGEKNCRDGNEDCYPTCDDGDRFDDSTGVAWSFFKKVCGNTPQDRPKASLQIRRYEDFDVQEEDKEDSPCRKGKPSLRFHANLWADGDTFSPPYSVSVKCCLCCNGDDLGMDCHNPHWGSRGGAGTTYPGCKDK